MREVGDIFREVSQAAGDIVFRYDIVTEKFMQYSDRSELAKYGAWLSDFDSSMINAKMIYPDDVEAFQKLADRIKSGDVGTIEGFFRLRLHISADYRCTDCLQGRSSSRVCRMKCWGELRMSMTIWHPKKRRRSEPSDILWI